MLALLEQKIVPEDVVPFAIVVAIVMASTAAARAFTLSRPERGGYRGQLALFIFIVLGLLLILVFLPFEKQIQSKIFDLTGIVLSAAVVLSSTTFLGNLVAGGMLRTVRHFAPGDWIRVGEEFGRVTERGLLHVEIQTQNRDLTTIPNMTLATQPVTVVRRSGTIVEVSVGLGYDVPHARVESALVRAATDVGLSDAHVAIDELGDFAVTYRVSGFLAEVDELLSRCSKLRRAALDTLHEAGIEIMSPNFMNVLQRTPGQAVIPAETGGGREAPRSPESVAFDKADAVRAIEEKRETLAAMAAKLQEIDDRLDDLEGEERERLDWEKARIQGEAKHLEAEIEDLEGRVPED